MSLGTYRTKTYIAADWTGDKDAIEELYKWKNSSHWDFDFVDAHDLTQARDSSLNCSIKASLKQRMDVSKTFVLIVGNKTSTLRSGSCQYCSHYNAWLGYCSHGHSIDQRSYIEYECEKAIEANMKIVVLYNFSHVDKERCPKIIRSYGKHIPMLYWKGINLYWNYETVRNAILGE